MPTGSTNRLLTVAALAFLAALAPVIVGAWLLHESAAQRDEERIVRLQAEIEQSVSRENRRYIDYLFGVGSECAAGLTEEQWKQRRSTEAWSHRFPNLLAVGWAPNVPDLAKTQTQLLADRQSALVATPLPVGENSHWRERLEHCREFEKGGSVIDGGQGPWMPSAEVPNTQGQVLVVFVPVHSSAPSGDLAGFALGELQWRPILEESLTRVSHSQLRWDIHSLDEGAGNANLAILQPAWTDRLRLDPFWKEVGVTLAPTAEFWRDSQRQQPWLIVACGIPLALVVAWVAARQSQRRAALEARVAERTVELRTAHDRLAEALTHERELNTMKTNFISMVTHELRTPLSVVQSSTDILSRYLDRLPDEKRAEHFRAISHAVHRITDLSDEVLLFSRFESQRVQLKVAPLALESLCQSLVGELQSATSEKCPITFTGEPSLPMAHADERLLRHVLVNLLSNAVKYSSNGSPVFLKLTRQGDHAIFVIEDHGMGIAASEQARLFHSFHRGSNVEHLPGTGLGLVIVKRCVELHGGTIALQSEEGKGTSVTVHLPIFVQPKPDSTP